jgi:hypothetical protein
VESREFTLKPTLLYVSPGVPTLAQTPLDVVGEIYLSTDESTASDTDGKYIHIQLRPAAFEQAWESRPHQNEGLHDHSFLLPKENELISASQC